LTEALSVGGDGDLDMALLDVTADPENAQMHLIAKMAAGLLSKHYANHLWMVGWAPGMTLIIKLMGSDTKYGYTVDAHKAATTSELEKAIVWGGGELLERLGMRRGAWDGEAPTQLMDTS
jgi:hypothetical protein